MTSECASPCLELTMIETEAKLQRRRLRQRHPGHRAALQRIRVAMAKEGISPEQGDSAWAFRAAAAPA